MRYAFPCWGGVVVPVAQVLGDNAPALLLPDAMPRTIG